MFRARYLTVFAVGALTAAAFPAFAQETAEVAKETISNPYGLEALWTQGDFVARATSNVIPRLRIDALAGPCLGLMKCHPTVYGRIAGSARGP